MGRTSPPVMCDRGGSARSERRATTDVEGEAAVVTIGHEGALVSGMMIRRGTWCGGDLGRLRHAVEIDVEQMPGNFQYSASKLSSLSQLGRSWETGTSAVGIELGVAAGVTLVDSSCCSDGVADPTGGGKNVSDLR
jgi:hypothetical protein